MPIRVPPQLSIDPTCAALLHAVGVPASLVGGGKILTVIMSCLTAAESRWPDTSIPKWREPLHRFPKEVRNLTDNEDFSSMSLLAETPIESSIYSVIVKWKPSLQKSGKGFSLDALLGRAIVVYGQNRSPINGDLLSGLSTLELARKGKGSRSADWTKVLALDLESLDNIEEAKDVLGPQGPCHRFLNAIAHVLRSNLLAPGTAMDPTLPVAAADLEGNKHGIVANVPRKIWQILMSNTFGPGLLLRQADESLRQDECGPR